MSVYRRYRYALLCYAILILVVSGIPGARFPESKLFSFDKLLHAAEYAVFGFLALNSWQRISLKHVLLVLVIGCAFSGLDESWQSLIPGRNSDLLDMLADNIGIWIGTGIGLSLKSLRRND